MLEDLRCKFSSTMDYLKASNIRYEKTEPYYRALCRLLGDFIELEAIRTLISHEQKKLEEQFEYYRLNSSKRPESWKDYKDKFYCLLFDNNNHKCRALNDAWAVLAFAPHYNRRSSNRLIDALCTYAKEKASEILNNEEKYPEEFIIYFKVQLGLIQIDIYG